jgi:hypothetical protein
MLLAAPTTSTISIGHYELSTVKPRVLLLPLRLLALPLFLHLLVLVARRDVLENLQPALTVEVFFLFFHIYLKPILYFL